MKQDLMVNNSTRLVQIIATVYVLGLIESACMMKEVKVIFAIAGTTGMSKCQRVKATSGQVPTCNCDYKYISLAKLVVSIGKGTAASELYVDDVFMSFRKYCRWMSQPELLD